MSDGPLAGIKALDFAGGRPGSLAAFLLADLGAEVVRVDTRIHDNAVGHSRAVAEAATNRNKRTWAINLGNVGDVVSLRDAVASADVVIQDEWSVELDAVVDLRDALERNTALVRASVVASSTAGEAEAECPTAERSWPDIRSQAVSGMARLQGRVLGQTAYIDQAAGVSLAYAVLAALVRRDRTGRGDAVHASLQAAALFLQAAPIAEYSATGHMNEQHEYSARFPVVGVYEAMDGPFFLAAYMERDWRAALDVVNRPDLAADPRFDSGERRIANREELRGILAAVLSRGSRDDWVAAFEERGVMAGNFRDQRALLSYEQLAANDVLRAHRLPDGSEAFFPRSPYRFSGRADRSAVVDETDRGHDRTSSPTTTSESTVRGHRRSGSGVIAERMRAPLAGVRIVDMTHAVAGPVATQLLSDLGAEIWKVESPLGGDFLRGLAAYGYEAFNRNKQSVAVDLKTLEGRAAVLEMIGAADVFIHSQRADVIESLGLTRDDLYAVNQNLVHVGLSGFGDVGPERHRRGVDALVQAESGLAYLQGGVLGNITIVDQLAGCFLALATLAGLRGRTRSGQGSAASVSLLEVAVFLQAEYVGQASLGLDQIDGSDSAAETFEASDGRFVVFPTDRAVWQIAAALVGKDPPEAGPANGTVNGPFSDQPRRVWIDRFRDAGFNAAPMNAYPEVLGSDRAIWDTFLEPVITATGHRIIVPKPAYEFSSAVRSPTTAAAPLGRDTDDVLSRLGVDVMRLRFSQSN
jgi:CoA:oxalate CoA-transferase